MTAPASPAESTQLPWEAVRWAWLTQTVGALVLMYGFLLFVLTAAYWASIQPPGSTVGPPSFIQDLTLKIAEGIYLAAFGSVLVIGGSLLMRNEGRPRARSVRSIHWRSLLPVAAVAVIVAAAIVGRLPPSQRSVSFEPSDFALRSYPGGGPYENYLVSTAFEASKGEALFPGLSITWTDRTGAVVERDNSVTALVTTPSEPPDRFPSSGSGNLAPADGSYVLWVRYTLCETPTTPPCSNYTVSVAGFLLIVDQQAHVPVQLALGVAGSACIAATLVHPGIGRRLTVSR